MRTLVTCFMLVVLVSVLDAQDTIARDTIRLHGRVVSGSRPLYAVNVVRVDRASGTVTNLQGDFSLPVVIGEEVRFSAVGFQPVGFAVPDTVTTGQLRILVNLPVDTVELGTAIVRPWPSKTMFRQAFISEREEERRKPGPFSGFVDREIEPTEPSATIFNPISFLYERFGRDARLKRKLKKYRQMARDAHYYEAAPDTVRRY